MPRYETVEQYRDRYWRKVFNKSTMKDLIIEKRLEIDRVAERTQKLNKRIESLKDSMAELGKLRDEQITLLDNLGNSFDNIRKALEKTV